MHLLCVALPKLLSGLGMTSTHQQSATAQQQNVTRGNVTTTAGGNATNVTAAGETTTLGGPTASQGEGADAVLRGWRSNRQLWLLMKNNNNR